MMPLSLGNIIPIEKGGWESRFLGRLIRSLGSLRRRKGSGALEEMIGAWDSKEEERTSVFFPSTFLSLSHMKHHFL